MSGRQILRSIGPVWDGNEVWLLATGGVLYFVFPQLYASSFSGFYLPLMMVLWLLMLRAIGVEFRTHIDDGIWASFFDGIFSIGSLLLAVFYGAALGNVVRGLPLGPDHYFFLPLWTNWRIGAHPGVLDWYTVLCGVVALVALCVHGANYIVVKTDGELNERARRTSLVLTPVLLVLTLLSLFATLSIRPELARQLHHPADWICNSAARIHQPGRSLRFSEGQAGGLGLRLRSAVSGVHAGGSGVRALPGDSAGNRSGVQPDHFELDHRQLCAAGWVALVDHRHGDRSRLFRIPVSDVPGQGER